MKYTLTAVLCFIQIFCFSQKKNNIKYQAIDGKDYFIEETSAYKSAIVLYKKTYTNRIVSGNEKVDLKKGNYIIQIDKAYMKFSINKNGNLDEQFEIQDIYRNQLRKSKMLIKDGYLQNRTLYDSIDSVMSEINRYYYQDSIKDVEILSTGKKTHKIKFATGKTITREYDKDGKLLDQKVVMMAGIGRPK